MTDVEIEMPVVVIIAECGARRITKTLIGVADAGSSGDISKVPGAMLVVEQMIAAVGSQVDIVEAVIVVITDGYALSVTEVAIKA